MKIKIWGVRGSIPTPLSSATIEQKLFDVIYNLPDSLDTTNAEQVRAYLAELPYLLRGTAGGNTSCVEIQVDDDIYIIDAGSGIRNLGLELLKGPCGRGQGKLHIFFSHPHWDHIQGFPFFVPAYIPGNQISFYGVHDIEKALTEQQQYLFFPVSIDKAQAEREGALLDPAIRARYPFIYSMQADLKFFRIDPGSPFSVGPLTVHTMRNHHPGDAYSYRFEDDRSIFVYASDAEYKDMSLDVIERCVSFFEDADALLFDAQYGLRDSWESKVDFGHSAPMIGVDFARQANVKCLLLTHHDPQSSDVQLLQMQSKAAEYQELDQTQPACEVLLAYEGLTIDLAPLQLFDWEFPDESDTTFLILGEHFDETTVNSFAEQLKKLAAQEVGASSVLDLSQVTKMTTAALKELIMFTRQHKEGQVVLASLSKHAQGVIRSAGYEDYFAIYETVEQAHQAIQAAQAMNMPGQIINGRYQIISQLQKDLYGTVFEVFDQTLDQTTALRILSPTFTAETIDRLMAQKERLTHLNHPNIVQVYDIDRTTDGQYAFIVESLPQGQPLTLKAGDENGLLLNMGQAFDWVLDLTLALTYLHGLGIIHGRLAGEHIFVHQGNLKLSGLGLRYLQADSSLQDAPALFHNATYLAPEQILNGLIDARTDLYALGVLLYTLFTGLSLFEGTPTAIMDAHLNESPIPPRSLNNEVSRSLQHCILKLLAKHPNERYASAQQVQRVVSAFILGDHETDQAGKQLVGREQSLSRLNRAWYQAKAGQGQLFFITGEPGIGKTTLARQIAAERKASMVLVGYCQQQTASTAYHPFSEVLQAYFETVPPELDSDEMLHLMGYFASLIPDVYQRFPAVPQVPALEPEQEQLRLVTNLTRFVKQATQTRPWLLILDDLQWIDDASVELLRYLGRHLPDTALLIVGTYRDMEVGKDHRLQTALRDLEQLPICHTLPLDRLGQKEVASILENFWTYSRVPHSLIQLIYNHTNGNPLYVEEIAKGLVDDRLVVQQDGRWQFPELKDIQLPRSIYEAVEARIHYLNAQTRDLLSQAAVLGQNFRFNDIAALSGLAAGELLDHLDMALERQLIQEVGTAETLRFRHAEIHHVIYNELGYIRRRRLHRRAGELLEARLSSDTVHLIEELAYHFREAEEWEKAIKYSFQAGQQAQAVFVNETALIWYQQAVEMCIDSGDKQTQIELHTKMGEIFTLVGRYEDAQKQYQTAYALLQEVNPTAINKERLANLCHKFGEFYERQSNYELAEEWVVKGRVSLQTNATSLTSARLDYLQAGICVRQNKFDRALEFLEKSTDTAVQTKTDEGNRLIARSYILHGLICKLKGDFVESRHYCIKSIELFEQLGDQIAELALLNLGNAQHHLGEWEQALDAYDKVRKICVEIGDTLREARSLNNLANIHLDQGNFEHAETLYAQAQSIVRQQGNQIEDMAITINLAKLYTRRQELEWAYTCLEEAQELQATIKNEIFLPELQRCWATYYLQKGNIKEGISAIDSSIRTAIKRDDIFEEGVSRRVLGEIYLQNGELELAKLELRQSLRILEELDSLYEVARTRLVYGICLLECRELNKAKRYLDDAQATFEKLGAAADRQTGEMFLQRLNDDGLSNT